MSRVGASDLVWLHALSADLGDLREHRQTTDAALGALAERFGSAVSTYSEVTLPECVVRFDGVPIGDAVTDLQARLSEHPLFAPVLAGSSLRAGAPIRLSDVIPTQAWREHPIYREILAPRLIPVHSICLPVSSSAAGQFTFYQLNRADKDFTQAEAGLLARLQPVLMTLARRNAPPARSATTIPLTHRESQTLRHIAEGLTVVAAARRMGVSPATARKHLERIHAKLGTSGPVATVLRAMELGLLDLPSRG